MFSKLPVWMIGCAALSFVCSTAAAQDMEAFKTRMNETAAVAKVDLNAALLSYLELRTKYAGPEIDYSLGRTYQRLYQCKEAQNYLTQVMVSYELPDAHPVYQRAVKDFDAIAACDSWQKVRVESDIPAGGYVMIDDEKMSSFGDREYSLPPGEHVFKLFSRDGKSVEVKFTAENSGKTETISLSFPPEKVEVENVVAVEHNYYYQERFHPALYWGLIAGGVAVVAVGGFMSGIANSAYADEQKYADRYAVLKNESDKKKANDARDKVKNVNIAMYTLIGVGAAAAVTGAALAIVSAVSEKERIEDNSFNAYVTPSPDGVSLGLGFQF